jgi:hypothetical protein
MRGDDQRDQCWHDGPPGPAPTCGQSVAAWLCSTEADNPCNAGPVPSLGRQLRNAGLVLDRLLFHVGTLHPDVFAQVLAWTPDGPVEFFGRDDRATVAAGFPGSPFRQAASRGSKVVAQNPDLQFLGRAAGDLLNHRGIGELACAPFCDCDGRTVIVSFCVAGPRRFAAADHALMDHAIASLRQGRRRARPA